MSNAFGLTTRSGRAISHNTERIFKSAKSGTKVNVIQNSAFKNLDHEI